MHEIFILINSNSMKIYKQLFFKENEKQHHNNCSLLYLLNQSNYSLTYMPITIIL